MCIQDNLISLIVLFVLVGLWIHLSYQFNEIIRQIKELKWTMRSVDQNVSLADILNKRIDERAKFTADYVTHLSKWSKLISEQLTLILDHIKAKDD